jgi:AraC-like DNA-binding protein
VMMPDLNGVELLKKIKASKETAHIPVALVSGKYEIAQQIEAMEAGAELYITKPFNSEFLKISIIQIMERKEKLKDYFNLPISAFDLTAGKTTHKEDTKFLKSILKIIRENITEKELSGQLIADKLHIGMRSLYRKLEEIEVSSLSNLIKECRIQLARDMLVKSKMTIDEITYKSGFSNKSTFFKTFHDKYGCTPREYRKNAMKQEVYKQGAGDGKK